jgi:hypothetical protein
LKTFKKGLEYGGDNLGESNKFDSVYIECLRGYMQCCRDIGKMPCIGSFLIKTKIQLSLDCLGRKEVETALKRSPYDLSHITRLFLWESPELVKMNSIPIYLSDETNIIHVFSETDNFLGAVNTKRSEIIKKINSKESVSDEEIAKLLWLSVLINNHPGTVKACSLIQSKILPNSFSKIQYSLTRTMEQSFEITKVIFISALKYISKKLDREQTR